MGRKHSGRSAADRPSIRQEERLDEKGRVIVNMNVGDDSNFLSVFSVTEKPVISGEVAEFLDYSTQLLLPDTAITLRIHSNCIDADEQKIYTAAIRQFYREQYFVAEKEQKRNSLAAAFLLLLGVVCLGWMVATEAVFGSAVWSEVIDIAAWVFLWESVDIHFFQNRKLKIRKKRCLSFINMHIEYREKENP